jgi:hypothetical protein
MDYLLKKSFYNPGEPALALVSDNNKAHSKQEDEITRAFRSLEKICWSFMNVSRRKKEAGPRMIDPASFSE